MRPLPVAIACLLLFAVLPWSDSTLAEPPPVTVLISEVHPNPDGHPSEEFVEVHVPDDAPGPADMSGWTLTDNDGGPELVLGRVSLEPGAHLVIWNGRKPDGVQGLSCGRGSATWNDAGDDVVLLDAGGEVRARLVYGTGEGIDPPEGGEGVGSDPTLPCPGKGRSLVLDPVTGIHVIGEPSPGRAHVPPGKPKQEPDDQAPADGGTGPPIPPAASEPDPPPAVLLHSVHPGGSSRWEHVILASLEDRDVDLSNWSISDGEGAWQVPVGTSIPTGGRTTIAADAGAFSVLWGQPPDAVANVVGSFCLADRGDGMELLDQHGAVVDQIWYGAPPGDPPHGWLGEPVRTLSSMPWGALLQRRHGPDSDTAMDWTGWTEPRCGWLDPPPALGKVEAMAAAFVTPDGGWRALAGVLAAAEDSIDAALYDLTSRDLTALLALKAREGVGVRLLLEADVVGLDEGDVKHREGLVAALDDAGVEVHRTLSRVEGVRDRPYRYHHEKYCVVDGRTTVVTTENWCLSSFPSEADDYAFGSRGWGAVVECPAIAGRLLEVFEHDIATYAERWRVTGAERADLPGLALPLPPPEPLGAATVGVLVGPEGWGEDLEALEEAIDGARARVYLELASLEVRWGDTTSPLVEALLRAAARGVDVRLVLDPDATGEGRTALEELHAIAADDGIGSLRGVLASGIPGVSRVHAKGMVVDGTTAVLGSMNWVWSSVARNREVVLVIRSPRAAEVLEGAFLADWNASTAGTSPAIPRAVIERLLEDWTPPDDTVPLPAVPAQAGEGAMDDIGAREEAWIPWARAALVLAVGVALWALNARFGLYVRVVMFIEDLWEAGLARVRRLARRLNPRKGDGPRTTCPEPVLVLRSPRGPLPEPPPEPPPKGSR